MAHGDIAPPRKKSRFFPNGKSMIGSIKDSKSNDSVDNKIQDSIEALSRIKDAPAIASNPNKYACVEDTARLPQIEHGMAVDPSSRLSSANTIPIRHHQSNNVLGEQKTGASQSQSFSGSPTDSHTFRPFIDDTNNTVRVQESASHLTARPMSNTMLDIDRDVHGVLLPLHFRSSTTQVSNPQYDTHATTSKHSRHPADLFGSPKRWEHALDTSVTCLKRKRNGTNPPPPAYIYIRSDDPNFNVFSNGFLLYPELCFVLAAHMPLKDLICLYSISKDFHTIIDSRFTTTCLTQALRKAPQSARTFQFRSYAQYCRIDPAARIPHPNPAKAALQIPRKIPSFQWVAFVLHREKVVHELMTVFAERGCPLPARCGLALKKMWLIMDIPDNARRIAMIHNHRIFTDLDLYFLMCFIVKLDMVANDPVANEKRDGLRKLLLSQQGGLATVLKVLKREVWQKKSDFLITWVKTSMSFRHLSNEQLDQLGIHSVFGIPREEIGIGKYEFWGTRGIKDEVTGKKRPYLLRPDQLVMREAIRRGMRFTKHFLRCVLYGYVRPDTLENYAPRRYGRRIEDWKNEDYDINDSIGGLRTLSIEEGGDPLLDLGDKNRGSRWTIVKEPISDQEKAMRESQAAFLKMLYEISEKEQQEYTQKRISR